MSDISRAQAQQITAQIKDALEPILKEHGLVLGSFRSKYGYKYGLSLDATTANLDEHGINHDGEEAQAWAAQARMPYYPLQSTLPNGEFNLDVWNLDPEAVGREFTMNGAKYRLVGMASGRSKKYAFIARREADGQMVKVTDSPQVLAQLATKVER